jgi:amino acid adenylation domain-containing protein/non-ribosomal peptide synthase protein (TIGR01720 family)
MSKLVQRLLQLPSDKRAVVVSKLPPMSFAQQRLWFLNQLDPDSDFYNIPAFMRLNGNFKLPVLERTLNEIRSRHDILRTTFAAIDGQAVQIINPPAHTHLPVVDLRGLNEAAREKETQRLVNEELRRPFNLAVGPFLRVTLLRLDHQDYVVMAVMHHIVTDGSSIGVLNQEVTALYGAYAGDRPSPLPKLPIQYADYARWQRNLLQGEVLDEHLDYWRRQLEDLTDLQLPTDHPRPPVQSYRGSMRGFSLKPEVSQSLNKLAPKHGATLFMTLLAAFQILLHRYTSQDDIVVGTVIANRNRPELQGLIGFLTNTLVIKGTVEGDPTFIEFLQSVREVCLEAFAHQELPFDRLVQELQPERDPSRSPLFQVLFQLQTIPASSLLDVSELSIKGFSGEAASAKFDLSLLMTESPLGVSGSLEYATDLFEASTIERFINHFQILITAIAGNPEQRISQLRMLSDREERQLLSAWNETRQAIRNLVPQLFEQQVERTPEAIALSFGDEQLTYRELNQRANQLAHHLNAIGVGPEVITGICVERSVEMVVGLLGILKAGGAYLPIDPSYPLARKSFMLEDAGVAVIVTQSHLSEQLPTHWGQTVYLDSDGDEIAARDDKNLSLAIHDENLAYVIYTSGSTGQPKGVLVHHRGLANYLSWASDFYCVNEVQVSPLHGSISFDLSVTSLYPALLSGATVKLIGEGNELEVLGEVLASNERALVKLTPSHLRALGVGEDEPHIGSGHVLVVGGESLPGQTVRWWREGAVDGRLINEYGPTEAVVGCCIHEVEAGEKIDGEVSIGRPIWNTQMFVLGREQELLPVGAIGELYIGGEGLARGYLGRPEQTAERFIPNPFGPEAGARLYRTGDRGRYLANGEIEYLGRADEQVKIRGYRIELGEVETALDRHAAVRECVVVAREDRLVGYVVATDGTTVTELREHMRASLPDYMTPSAFVLLDRLPLTANGKIDRKALPAPETVVTQADAGAAELTPIEEMLAGIWTEILAVTNIGRTANFFDLGGHSLLATQFISRVRDVFNIELPLRALFEAPVLSELAIYIETRIRAAAGVPTPPLTRAERESEAVLSFAQQRLWFIDQLEPDSAFYNNPMAVRLSGSLNKQALKRTFTEIIRRHEALRTTFHTVNNEPIQVIAAPFPAPLPENDLSALAGPTREAEVIRLARQEAELPTDLSRGPLLRLRLIKLDTQEHVVLLTMHHIISDGWSTGILIHEVATLYRAYYEERESPLPELNVQYADFAIWQRSWLQGEALEHELQYWEQQLRGAATLELPTDRVRPASPSRRGGLYSQLYTSELNDALVKLSRREGTTLFMTALAAFQALLSRYSGQTDIVIGTDVANRNQQEIEPLIGFFINQLVMRTEVKPADTFRQLLAKVKEVCLGAYAHQDVPFEKLVEELQPERDLSRTPLFQVKLMLQNAADPDLELPGLRLSGLRSGVTMARFDLMLVLSVLEDGLVGAWIYSKDLFNETTIARLNAHYTRVLEAIVADPEQTISALPLLSQEEQTQLLTEWNDTEFAITEYDSIAQAFEARVKAAPDSYAVVCGATQITYAELNRRANQLAHYLKELGVGPEVLVGICLKRDLEMVVSVLAVIKAGGAYLPLDPAYPIERLAVMLDDSQAPVLLTTENLIENLPTSSAQVLCLDGEREAIASQSETNLRTPITADNTAYVIYTSGTTGLPKGVMVPHRGVINLAQWQADNFGVTNNSRISQFASYNFDGAVGETVMALLNGATLVMLDREDMEPAKLVRALNEQRINVCVMVPSMLKEMDPELLAHGDELSIVAVGEACSQELAVKWSRKCKFSNAYGPTEYTVYSHLWLVNEEEVKRDECVPIGWPIHNSKSYILDANLEPVPAGMVGEIYISGPGLARGYLNKPELTAERFLPNRFHGDTLHFDRMYKTGDLGRYLTDGRIEFRGRVDTQVKLRGFRIELAEIEAVLLGHEDVRDCVVIALEDERGAMSLVAYAVPNIKELSSVLLRSYLKEKLPDYMVPAALVFMDELPLTSVGKIDRRALPSPKSLRAEVGIAHDKTLTPIEELLAGLWCEVLNITHVRAHENFFELGGHSLVATQLISRIRESLGLDLPLRVLFEAPVLSHLAVRVEDELSADRGMKRPPLTKTERGSESVLSFAQQRLWFIDQLEPNTPLYNNPLAVRMRGKLDRHALERTFSEIVRRHEVLRTTFKKIDGGPRQVVHPAQPVRISVIDLCKLEPGKRELELRRLAQAEASEPFDFTRDSLLRIKLVKTEPDEHVALMTMHHIISDGWSMGVLINEVTTLYRVYYEGLESPLPELEVQYADFAIWQRNWLQGEALELQLNYWKDQLGGAATIALPTDRPYTAAPRYRGERHYSKLDAEISDGLYGLSQREGTTLFMTVLAALQALLSRYSGQTDIVVGTDIANRNRHQIEPLIGFFVNQLVMRSEIKPEQSFTGLLAAVKEVCLGAYAHQDVPFEKLVEELQPERDLTRSPLFQVKLLVQRDAGSAFELPGLTLSTIGSEGVRARFDLMLAITETDVGLVATWLYSCDLFDPTTIARLSDHFIEVLRSVVTTPELSISALTALPIAEQQQLLEWNETRREFALDKFVHQFFEEQAELTPAALAVVFEDATLSYGELNQRANQLAHYLRQLNVQPDQLVGIAMERSLELVVALLAVLKAGAAYVPLDPEYPRERLAFMLQDADVSVLLTQNALLSQLPEHHAQTICLESEWDDISKASDTNPCVPITPDNLAYVIYTSGSTGTPKGAMNSHRAICNRLLWMQEAFQLTDHDRVLQKTPFSFDVSVWEFFWPLMFGAQLVVARPGGHRDSAYLARLIAEEKITTLHFVPSLLRVWLEEPELNRCESLRRVICSGEALDYNLQQRFFEVFTDVELHNLYGPTEAAVDVTAWQCANDNGLKLVPIGRPIANLQIHLLDQHLEPVPVGVKGELYIGGVGLARGYWNRPELTAEQFIPHPYSREDGERLYRTGDVGRYLHGGEIEYLGRVDEQVKIRGYRIELGEIEAVLGGHPAVRECVVMAREEMAGDKRLVAYFVPNEVVYENDLREHLRASLPKYMVPPSLVSLDHLPLNANGKVDRKALPAPGEVRATDESGTRTSLTPTEEMLAGIWAEVLRVTQVCAEDNFFDLGGHSLLATQLISRIRDVFNLELPLRVLFESPVLSHLAVRIDEDLRAEMGVKTPPLTRVERGSEAVLSFAQQRLWFLDQLEPNSAVYNNPLAVRLTGKLNKDALKRTLTEIVRRHEVLRTSFAIIEGQAVQVIAPPAPVSLPELNIGEMPEAEREVFVRQLAGEEAAKPFDLTRSPILRVQLIQLGAEEHVVLLTMHHIISDGWSMGVFINEVVTLYRAYCEDRESPLPELSVQYADFALWQRGWLQGEALDQQLRYWEKQLRGVATLELPADRPRPLLQSHKGANHSFTVDASVSERVKELSRGEGTTLFMTLLAVFQVLLSRYSGQGDIVVGSPIAGRTRQEIEALIGFFVNTLVLRSEVDGAESFNELLAQVKDVCLGAYAHQDIPFEKLVEELQPERDLSRSPLFQVMFVLQNVMGGEAVELPGLKLSGLESESVTAKFDLLLTLSELPAQMGGINGNIEYSTDLFDESTIERMGNHFCSLLKAIVDEPARAISALQFLTNDEHEQLLSWNQTQHEFADVVLIHESFAEQVNRTPAATAVIFGAQQLNYVELNQRANQLANHLRSLGVGPETIVGVCFERSFEMVVALLGVLKAGAAYLPIDPEYPAERISFILEDAGVSVVLTHDAAALSRHRKHLINLDTDGNVIAGHSAVAPVVQIDPENPAYVLYTSGSTGQPKGVMVPHHAIANHMQWMLGELSFTSTDRVLQKTPYTFDASVWEFYAPLMSGGTLVMAPAGVHRDPAALVVELIQHGITQLQLVPTMLQLLVEEKGINDCVILRRVFSGGEALTNELVARFHEQLPGVELGNLYGPTEATIDASIWCSNNSDSVTLGRPIWNTQMYVLGKELELLSVGASGELYIAGAGLARGYVGRADLTAERFVPHPYSDGERLYRTGDLARYRANGEIEYLGRADEQVKIRGYRIELGEIEAVLAAHESVRQCVVVARVDESGNKRLVGYVVAKGKVEASDLREHLRVSLPDYMTPAALVFMDGLPLTTSGKIDRLALPAPDWSHLSETLRFAPPRSAIENTLAQIWGQVLGLERVGIYDNFFDLGGDSILSIQIVSRASAAGIRLTAKQLFQHQTIAALAQLAELTSEQETIWADQGVVTGPVALTPIQQQFFATGRTKPEHFNQSVMLRLSADLDVNCLREAIRTLALRHDALRMCFTRDEDGQWRQFNTGTEEPMPLVSEIEADTNEIADIANQVQRSLSLAGPLMRAVVFRTGMEAEPLLLLVIHHLIVDGVSWRILLEDLQSAYEQARRGNQIQLPPKTSSFQQWAALLTEYAASEHLIKDASYWQKQPWHRAGRLPLDHENGRNRRASARQAVVQLTREQTSWLLQEAPAAYRTRIQELLLIAFGKVLADWTGSEIVTVDLEGHGREETIARADVTRTVGWFTTMYPVLIRVEKDWDEATRIKSVKEQLRAVPDGGLSYGVARYLGQQTEDTEANAEVLFNYLGQFDQALGGDRSDNRNEVAAQRLILGMATENSGDSEDPEVDKDHLLEINGAIAGGRLGFSWSYSSEQFDAETIEQVAAQYHDELVQLIEHCRSGAGGRTPADYQLTQLTQPEVDQIAGDGRALEDIYPVTPLQQGLLFHSLYEPDAGFYHIQMSCNLGSGFEATAFIGAWQEVVDRHAILRTAFVWQGVAVPLQVVYRTVPLPVVEFDWRDLDATEQRERWEKLRLDDRTRGFDLKSAPLMRLVLVRSGDDNYKLLWSHHHLLLDAWCMNLVVSQVFEGYERRRRSSEILTATAETRPFKDYIAWLQQQDMGQAESFWREALRGFSEPTPLPLERRNKPGETQLGVGTRRVNLGREQTHRLQERARREQLTMNTVLQGAWSLLLARYSGTRDIVFATTVSGRSAELAGIEEMVGLFINTLPVRVRVNDGQRIWDWLRALQQQQVEMRQYEFSPLAQVQQWSEVAAGTPLFQTLLTYENHPMPESMKSPDRGTGGGGPSVEEVDVWERTGYPLGAVAAPGPELIIELTYERDRFEDESIERVCAHLHTILEELASGNRDRVAAIQMLDSSERRRLLSEWNKTDFAITHYDSIVQAFETRVASAPESSAVVCGDEQISYCELNRRANQLAHHLKQLGVGPEVLVGICLERGIEMVVSVLAVLKSGGAYLPLDPAYPIERLAVMLDDSQAPVVITIERLLDNLPTSWAQVLCLDSEQETIASQSDLNVEVAINPDNTAYVIYTSGTTGLPKGVMVPHRGVINLAQWQADNFGVTNNSRISQFASYNFDGAVGETVMALLNGATLVMLDREDMEPAKLVRALNEQRINICVMVPSMLKEMDPELLAHGDELSIVAVGEACPQELAVKWSRQCKFSNAYGPTEYTVYSHLWLVNEEEVKRDECVPIGWPIHNSKSYILDTNLEPVPAGMVGEIYISGPGLARGYLNKPELTAERFIPNRFNDETNFVAGGDLAVASVAPEIEAFKEQWSRNGHNKFSDWREAIPAEVISRLVRGLDQDLQERTRAFVTNYSTKNGVYQGFCRYLLEAANGTYASSGINSEVLRRLLPYENFESLRGVDFGFGHGEVLQSLANLGAGMKGLDFNPLFVQQSRAKGLDVRMMKVDVAPESFAAESGIQNNSQDFGISTLLLDRLEQPLNMLKNLFQVLKDGGRFAIQTLLPIVGIDDGDIAEPIVYTPEAYRLTPGKDVEEDKLLLVSLLRACGAGDVSVYQLPYAVTSRDGLQEYTLWSFVGGKSATREVSHYDRMYKTGDLGRYLPDGRIEFRGRVDTQVKLRGFRIELAEIENVLLSHQNVTDCVVIARDDERGAKTLIAYVASDSTLSSAEVRSHLKEKLPDYMVPSAIVFMKELPLTSVGKIDRRALPAPEDVLAENENAVARTLSPVEEMLAGIWIEILPVTQVRANDNFFELGGHSLLGTQLVSRIRDVFDVDIALRTIFEFPVLSLLAARIEADMRADMGVQTPPIERIERGAESVLSFAQQRLWFLNQLQPDDPFYNSPLAVRLLGSLRKDSLERTLTEITRRHEVLRTSFPVVNGEPVQLIAAARPICLSLIDLSGLEDREALAQQLAREEASTPFDLSHGPLLRVKLVRLAEQDHVVLLTMHHIISDGWSIGVFVSEVAALYRAYYEEQESPLAELEVQYADFAIWQRNWLRDEVLASQLSYWETQLRGAAMLELPADRPRVSATYRGHIATFALGRELSDALKELSRREGTTLFMTTLAAFKLLLSRYSQQSDIVVGTPIAGRTHQEVEPLIGFFINSLALRTNLAGDPSFKDLLRRVREVCLGAYAHQEVPFEKLVEELQPERDASHAPFYEVTFGLQNAPMGTLEMPELELRPLNVENQTVRYDLSLWVGEGLEDLSVSWSYKSDLFDEQTIDRMQAHYRTLLESIVREPEARLSVLEMRTESERQEQAVKEQKTFDTNRRRFLSKRPNAVTTPAGDKA